ncbi:putative membrane protein [Acinetobacter baumannii 4749]|nr:putative membrane protein [Acinetobacter baumannii 4749]
MFAEIAWLIFCFGSIIIGLLLLIFSPMILLFPLLSLSGLGLAFLNSGVEQAKEL